MLLPRCLRYSTRIQTGLPIPVTVFSQKRSQASTTSFQEWRATSTKENKMASPNKVHLAINNTGVVKHKPQTVEAAQKVSELLQENHEKHHVFFNKSGFHNHIVHHLLTLYGLGAPADVIEARYKENASYQRPRLAVEGRILENMTTPEKFKAYLGNEKYYQDFLIFWQNEMDKKGWQNVLNEYLFTGTEQADNLLGRMYAGFLHPIIHLGFGIEFEQPAIIAEALAQAAVHENWTGDYLLKAEKAAKSAGTSNKTLPELLDEIRADSKLSNAADWNDANKIRDGILKRAPEEMLKYTTQWTVKESNLEEKTAEMINSAFYFTTAAQNPPKQVKMDFYYMHCVNSSIFWPTFNAQTWLTPASKVRLLQWKGYLDLVMYPSRRSPKLLLSEVSNYVPKQKAQQPPTTTTSLSDAQWENVISRLSQFQDDGHAIKFGRAALCGKSSSEKWEKEGKEWVRIKGDMWDKIGNMVVDSVEEEGENWLRSVGFKEAWENIGDRKERAAL